MKQNDGAEHLTLGQNQGGIHHSRRVQARRLTASCSPSLGSSYGFRTQGMPLMNMPLKHNGNSSCISKGLLLVC